MLACLKEKEESRDSQYTPKRNKCSPRHRHTSGYHILSWEYTAEDDNVSERGSHQTLWRLHHLLQVFHSPARRQSCSLCGLSGAVPRDASRCCTLSVLKSHCDDKACTGQNTRAGGQFPFITLGPTPSLLPQSSPQQSPSLVLRNPRGARLSGDGGSRGVTHPLTLTLFVPRTSS